MQPISRSISHPISLGLLGASGRMGKSIQHCLQTDSRFILKKTAESKTKNLDNFFEAINIAIDFSASQAFPHHLSYAQKHNIPLVVGTTGITPPKESTIPLFISSNMCVSIGVMGEILQKYSKFFKGFDIEISDEHHRNKIDSPSGTALLLADYLQKGLNQEMIKQTDRSGKREENTIGFSIKRAGNMPGKHSVEFISEREAFALSHTSYTREIFARGALDITAWMIGKPKGLYTLKDYIKESL